MQQSITIEKHPVLNESSDYALLRQKGMDYIQQLGSRLWTDYNIHDPGITILELLCYGITDLGYRTSLDIKDLLAVKLNEVPDHKRQAFYTAREILTVNPWTPGDFRKLLIDIDGVKNAWLLCKQCPCDDMYLYANCQKNVLQYEPTEHIIIIKGMYDILIEFEDEEGTGNLNSGKIKYNFSFLNSATLTTAAIEMRLPSWQKVDDNKSIYQDFRNPDSEIVNVTVSFISGTKDDNVDIPSNQLASRLRRPVYATMQVEFKPDKDLPATVMLAFDDIPLTVWFKSDADRKALQLADLKTAIEDASAGGIFGKYMQKIKKADAIIAEAAKVLHGHRNLAEDYCTIKAIETEDIGICADMEVESNVDIEAVLAEAYYLIDQYFSPDIKFYSLQQLLDKGMPVDEIFDGPALNNGFIDNEQLDRTDLRKVLYTSDIINLLMDIPGVKAVKNFVLTRYNDDGFLVENQPWRMEVSPGRQPRLYIEASKVLVFKNGLPFLPDQLELADTLLVIKGLNAQPKYSVLELDLPVPTGTWYDLEKYYPLQYSLPLTYGVGFEGLPSPVSEKRKAQAKQLKAYLLFYEQLLVNYLSQLSHVKDFFAVDHTVFHTYFSRLLSENEIKGVNEIYNGLTQIELQKLTEEETVFLDRRNRFLDHMLARFAEQFSDYALMLYSYFGDKKVAESTLITDKIEFLKAIPFMSRNRARSFNYKDPAFVCNSENVAGLQTRIERMLGFKKLANHFELFETTPGTRPYELSWKFPADGSVTVLVGKSIFTGQTWYEAEVNAIEEIQLALIWLADENRYKVSEIIPGDWRVQLTNTTGDIIAESKTSFASNGDGDTAADAILENVKKKLLGEKIYIVEHILLRPRNKPGPDFPAGDPLISICIPPNCDLCGEEDPYSFRLTVVMNGEEGLSNRGILFRRFAEQSIRMEVPAHLALKICWVSTVQMEEFQKLYCDWLDELAKPQPDALLLHQKLTALLILFEKLKSVYPPATLHDCVDGNDENRTYLNQTII